MTASSLVITAKDADGRWQLAGRPLRCDTAEVALSAENMAAHGLGVDNLMRLRRHDRAAPGWAVIGRLLRPLDTVTATLDSPPTTHRRRAMDDAVAVVLLRPPLEPKLPSGVRQHLKPMGMVTSSTTAGGRLGTAG